MEKIKELFDVEIISSNPFKRNNDDSVINIFLESRDGMKYFLKEVQGHSQREDFDELYTYLAQIKTERFHLVLPLHYSSDANKFKFQFQQKVFLLFKKEKLLPFEISKYPLHNLLDDLIFFQTEIVGFACSSTHYRNYESWLALGAYRFRKKHTDKLPFLDSFESFMTERFPQINFEVGNIHWDIHHENLALDENGKLIILDFDLLQRGALVTDLAAAASMYIDFTSPVNSETDQFYTQVFNQISRFAQGLELSDLKYLIKRSILGDWELIESKDELINKLQKLEYDIST